MNWYKQSQISWDVIYKRLREKLGRDPLTWEVQREMLKTDFEDDTKKKENKPSPSLITAKKNSWREKII